MKTLMLLLICTLMLFGCKERTETTIIVTNRSLAPIDSFSIRPVNIIVNKRINPGESGEATISISQINRYTDALLMLFVHTNNKVFTARCGFHYMDVFSEQTDSLYVFNNGISNRDTDIPKPDSFNIQIGCPEPYINFDSVKVYNKAFVPGDFAKGDVSVNFPYDDFRSRSCVSVFKKGKEVKAPIVHDWDNWQNNRKSIAILENGTVKIL